MVLLVLIFIFFLLIYVVLRFKSYNYQKLKNDDIIHKQKRKAAAYNNCVNTNLCNQAVILKKNQKKLKIKIKKKLKKKCL